MSSIKNIPAIPEPTVDPKSLRNSGLATKEAVEIIAGQRGPSPFVTWEDLVRLNIISQMDVPRR